VPQVLKVPQVLSSTESPVKYRQSENCLVKEEKQFTENEPWYSLRGRLIDIYSRKVPPEAAPYVQKLMKVNFTLLNEDNAVRPYDESGLPGGIVQLKKNLPTVIVPDLHARMDFFLSVMSHTWENDRSVLQMLGSEEIQVVCVGDGRREEPSIGGIVPSKSSITIIRSIGISMRR
jgi:hypothetical protein